MYSLKKEAVRYFNNALSWQISKTKCVQEQLHLKGKKATKDAFGRFKDMISLTNINIHTYIVYVLYIYGCLYYKAYIYELLCSVV